MNKKCDGREGHIKKVSIGKFETAHRDFYGKNYTTNTHTDDPSLHGGCREGFSYAQMNAGSCRSILVYWGSGMVDTIL